jgi:hypothetical protein
MLGRPKVPSEKQQEETHDSRENRKTDAHTISILEGMTVVR